MTLDPLICDCYSKDLSGKPDIAKLIAAGYPWSGFIGKATEGKNWGQGSWFPNVMAQATATPRLAVDWIVGGYHYVHFAEDPTAQVDFYLSTMTSGGWSPNKAGWLPCILDVERADNPDCAAQQIVDTVTAMADLITQRTGKQPILYGGSTMADKCITSHMGCQKLWIARYTATLPAYVEQRIGWNPVDLAMWQADGDGEGYLAGYPTVSPMGKCDISVVTLPGLLPALLAL